MKNYKFIKSYNKGFLQTDYTLEHSGKYVKISVKETKTGGTNGTLGVSYRIGSEV